MFVLGLGPVVDAIDAQSASEMLHSLGFVYQTSYLANTPFLGQNAGLVVYSKFPILREDHHTFSSRRSVSCKGWLEVTLELSTDAGKPRKLILFNTHLEHDHSSKWRQVREQQWKEVVLRAAHFVHEEPADTLITVLGDFNVCGDEFGRRLNSGVEYRKLCAEMLKAGFPHDLVSSATIPTMRAGYMDTTLRCSFDHTFVNSSLNSRVITANPVDTRGIDGLPVSDHYGILFDFIF